MEGITPENLRQGCFAPHTAAYVLDTVFRE